MRLTSLVNEILFSRPLCHFFFRALKIGTLTWEPLESQDGKFCPPSLMEGYLDISPKCPGDVYHFPNMGSVGREGVGPDVQGQDTENALCRSATRIKDGPKLIAVIH